MLVVLEGTSYRDRRGERHSKYINHLASLISKFFPINVHNLNFRTQIFFGTSVRKADREFGVLHCRISKYHEIVHNQILLKFFEERKGGVFFLLPKRSSATRKVEDKYWM